MQFNGEHGDLGLVSGLDGDGATLALLLENEQRSDGLERILQLPIILGHVGHKEIIKILGNDPALEDAKARVEPTVREHVLFLVHGGKLARHQHVVEVVIVVRILVRLLIRRLRLRVGIIRRSALTGAGGGVHARAPRGCGEDEGKKHAKQMGPTDNHGDLL
jgi:hypothetical protein